MLPRISNNLMRYLIIIIGIVLFLFLFLFPVVNTNFERFDKSTITIGLILHEFDKESNIKLDLLPWQEQYLIGQDSPLPVLSLEYINVPTELSEGDQVCIEEIKITGTFGTTKNVLYQIDNSEDEICFPAGQSVILSNDFQISPFLYEGFSNPFLYPFDTKKIKFDVSSNLFLKATGEKFEVEPDVLVSPDPPRWVVKTSQWGETETISNATTDRITYRTTYRTTLARYPFFKLLFFLVPISVFLIIFVILPSLTDDIWEVTVGLIFGLWGLSEVLIPGYIDYPTITEAIILFLYVVLASFVIPFILNHRKKTRETSSAEALASDIPVNEYKISLHMWAIKKMNEGYDSITIAEAFFIRAESDNTNTTTGFKKKLTEIGENFIT